MSRQKNSILINEHALNREPIPLSSNMTPRLSGHFFYIWFGFLCAQVSSGNCETLES